MKGALRRQPRAGSILDVLLPASPWEPVFGGRPLWWGRRRLRPALTKRQAKARAKAKAGRKARRRNRQ